MDSLCTLNVILFSFFTSSFLVQSKIHHHKWEITYQYKSPDCFEKLAITINGKTPGPTINAQQGDTVVVEVKNGLFMENIAIHWHGIRQIGTPWSDGIEGVTQCATMPRDTFVYRFVVDRAGTYIYHAHYANQRSNGLYGMIKVIVPDGVAEPFSYDYDRSFIFADWWHQSTYEQATGLSSIPFVWVGDPQSFLINGRGRYNCSLPGTHGVCNQTNPECSPTVLIVIPGKTYQLRLASITSSPVVNFEIEGHSLTVVETDGHYLKPFVAKSINIYSGETYSVLLKADQNPSRNYWIAINDADPRSLTPTGTAILTYHPNQHSNPPPSTPPKGPALSNDTDAEFKQSIALRSHPDYIQPPPSTSDRTILLLNTVNYINGRIRWAVNNVTLELPLTPYLVALKYGMNNTFDQNPPSDTYDYKNYDIFSIPANSNVTSSNQIYRLEFNSTVDVILQNANTMIDHSETHPWHLHGHNFWVLGHGKGKFDPELDSQSYNLVDPIMKNTVPLHAFGWTALRFRADNPGVWLFHCHVESHFFMGMGIVFAEGIDRVTTLPKNIMGCGESKFLIP